MMDAKRILKAAALLVLLWLPASVYAQSNLGFEDGLNNWLLTGNVNIADSNAHGGKNCVKIGPGGLIMQQIDAIPFAIVQFNIYVKTSDTLTKAYSFLRFFDANHKLLLEYKSGKVSTLTYQQTGNYTEVPPFTAYMEIGIESDAQNKGSV